MTTHLVDRPGALVGRGTAPYLRIGVVMDVTGLGRSTIYRLMADEQFPPPLRLTKRLVVWRRTDVEQWFENRPIAPH
jgi:prophage regulatory protein